VLIRRERDADVPAIRAVTTAAFARPETAGRAVPEATLVDELRAGREWLPPLSLVATDDGEITGHVVCTRGYVDGVPVLGLGPLSVRPDRQRQGTGSALVHAVLGAADALGEPLVALLGDPGYYGRFGFRPSTDYRVIPPDPGWDAYFQVRVLSGYDADVHGTFSYAEPFDRV
jgi:putative acetyltransferase